MHAWRVLPPLFAIGCVACNYYKLGGGSSCVGRQLLPLCLLLGPHAGVMPVEGRVQCEAVPGLQPSDKGKQLQGDDEWCDRSRPPRTGWSYPTAAAHLSHASAAARHETPPRPQQSHYTLEPPAPPIGATTQSHPLDPAFRSRPPSRVGCARQSFLASFKLAAFSRDQAAKLIA